MYLLKPIFFALFLLFIGKSSFAQTKFDNLGRLISIKITNNDIEPVVKPLEDEGKLIKEEIRALLLHKTEEAIRIIRSNNYKKNLHKLYLQIWSGDSTSLLTYLLQIETVLQSGAIANVAGLVGTSFNAIFNKHLSDTAMVFRWLQLGNREGVLVKKDVFKSFITDYYNETLPGIMGRNIGKEDIVETGYYLLEQTLSIDTLMDRYRASLGDFRKTMYDSLRNYHLNLMLASSLYMKSLGLLKIDWFKQWFWITGGEIRINPIDFGVDTITQAYVSELSKINIANRGTNDILLERRLDSLDNYFMLSKPQVAIVEKWVNKVSVPANSSYFQFSATDNIKFANDEKELKRSLYVDEIKVLTIHNIPSDRKAGLREDRIAIPNLSAFEEGLDDVISKLEMFAKAYGQITAEPWLLVSNFFAPRPKYNQAEIESISPPKHIKGSQSIDTLPMFFINFNSYKPIEVFGKGDDDFLAAIKTTLENDKLLLDHIFKDVFGAAAVKYRYAVSNSYKDKFKKQFAQYLELITQDAAKQILEDSFMIAGMIHIYNTASSPLLKSIKTNQNKVFSFYSSTLQTTPIDSTVECFVQPYTVLSKTNTDSIFMEKFRYKIGKTKRFTISAGLNYTLNSYDQSVANEENGTITITNNNQQYRFALGLNIYFRKGLYSLNNDLGKLCERWYGFLGVGIPKPLENLYIGVGRDLYPGLKLTAGLHLAKHNKYLIQNNHIVEERLRYQPAGPFLSAMIDPTSLINLLNIFKK